MQRRSNEQDPSTIKLPEINCQDNDFHPPVLGPTPQLCKQAASMGVPLTQCTDGKHKTLKIIKKQKTPVKLPTHRNVKNWQKWCRVWKQNQENLKPIRQSYRDFPLMCSGEKVWYKNEDKEFFERTLYENTMTGHNPKNTAYPVGLNPSDKDSGIFEHLSGKYFGQFPEIKRYRYPSFIRDEIGFHQRDPATSKPPFERSHKPSDYLINLDLDDRMEAVIQKTRYNHEENWRNSCSWTHSKWKHWTHPDAGFLDPNPEKLALIAQEYKLQEEETDKAQRDTIRGPKLNIEVVEDEDVQDATTLNANLVAHNYYDEPSGPLLSVVTGKVEMRFGFSAVEDDMAEDYQFFADEMETFSATTSGKDVKSIILKNEGTTAIRILWLRFPPTPEICKILSTATYSVLDEDFFQTIVENSELERDEKYWKPPCLEFCMSELPHVLLPGQIFSSPVTFRSQKPGHYYETFYLVTHPRICNNQNQLYSVKLTGICMDHDILTTVGYDELKGDSLNEKIKYKGVAEEAKDILDMALDHVLFVEPNYPSTLPYLRVTSESIFYAHNNHFKYYQGIAQKSLRTVRSLVQLLVPKDRVLRTDNLCILSIQNLYELLCTTNGPKDYYHRHLKSLQAERLLKNLAGYNNVLLVPRRFHYPDTNVRKVAGGYCTLIACFDEILQAMDDIQSLYTTPELSEVFTNYVLATQQKKLGLQTQEARKFEWTVEEKTQFHDKLMKSFSMLNNETQDQLKKYIRFQETQKFDLPLSRRRSEIKEVDKVEKSSEKSKEKSRSRDGSKPKKQKSKLVVTPLDADESSENPLSDFPVTPSKSSQTLEIPGKAVQTDPVLNTSKDAQAISASAPDQYDIKILMDTFREKHHRIYQAKRMVFEDLLISGIERVLCIVDSFNGMEDYRQSEFDGSMDVDFAGFMN